MTILCGKVTNGKISGETFVNGKKTDLRALKTYTGFVPQDDVCTEDITVWENLFFSALLRLPTNLSFHRKERIVNAVIELLGLEKVRNSVVGSVEKRGISGGQRKRVNMYVFDTIFAI
jgi:ABC-type multidrug transport system ATPase subunit